MRPDVLQDRARTHPAKLQGHTGRRARLLRLSDRAEAPGNNAPLQGARLRMGAQQGLVLAQDVTIINLMRYRLKTSTPSRGFCKALDGMLR